jgi:hypothetical protein
VLSRMHGIDIKAFSRMRQNFVKTTIKSQCAVQ